LKITLRELRDTAFFGLIHTATTPQNDAFLALFCIAHRCNEENKQRQNHCQISAIQIKNKMASQATCKGFLAQNDFKYI